MQSKEFIEKALRTEHTPTSLPLGPVSVKAALGMAIACANVMDILKKNIIYGKPIDLVELNSQLSEMKASGNYMEDTLNYKHGLGVLCNNGDVNIRLLHAAIGMFTESGELLEALLKQLNGMPLDKVNFGEEIGDNRWYEAIVIDELGISEDQILRTLLAKLLKRFPEKFTSEAALNRDLVGERKVLEDGVRS